MSLKQPLLLSALRLHVLFFTQSLNWYTCFLYFIFIRVICVAVARLVTKGGLICIKTYGNKKKTEFFVCTFVVGGRINIYLTLFKNMPTVETIFNSVIYIREVGASHLGVAIDIQFLCFCGGNFVKNDVKSHAIVKKQSQYTKKVPTLNIFIKESIHHFLCFVYPVLWRWFIAFLECFVFRLTLFLRFNANVLFCFLTFVMMLLIY